MPLLNILVFARALGIQVGLDYDDALLIEVPESTADDTIIAALEPFHADLIRLLKYEGRRLRSYHFGGPLDGKPHTYFRWGNPFHAVHIARAKWAVYKLDCDNRAIFQGYATSEQKARRGKCVATDGPK